MAIPIRLLIFIDKDILNEFRFADNI
jgi:hypothetical protein